MKKGRTHSYVRDVLVNPTLPCAAQQPVVEPEGSDIAPQAVEERLRRNAQDVRQAALVKRDKYGRYVERVLRTSRDATTPIYTRKKYREQMRELRRPALSAVTV